ncbi:phosphoribosylformylglycinamidine synthase I [Candidatus Woesearchaeota archaeon]|nr:phosphoribosylformylglycinamidine synthase I [Candidatus Woesearchaeota archaeon]
MKPKIAVILFPGTNREDESLRAIEAAGMDAFLFRWNLKEDITPFDGYFIPGGWSYEDRIRSGAIASKDPLMQKIKAEAAKGKPVIGICNGAQILVECGMIPGLKGKVETTCFNKLATVNNSTSGSVASKVEMALAPNLDGFWCFWTHLKNSAKTSRCAFNKLYKQGVVFQTPIAHGEGRFTTKDPAVVKQLQENDQVIFQYSTKSGEINRDFPINPNGAVLNAAAICNKEGNVMAMMPHPEVASFNKQLPYFEGHSFEECEQLAPAHLIFQSMKKYIEERKK